MTAGRLPSRVSAFVGRASHLKEITHLLSRPGVVTLVGPAGIGKTRQAQRAAESVRSRFDIDTCWVDLAPLTDPPLVVEALTAALGIHDQAGISTLDAVIADLGARRVLLALDNCEHLVDECAAFARTLLSACPQLTVLATSRQPLGVVGERLWRVPALSMAESAELFYERAGAHRVGFSVDDAAAMAVTDICIRLEGIPLAIELAAARVGIMAPTEIAAGLKADDARA